MHIKRYEAATLEEALARVKAELGPDALILSSRTVRSGRGTFGLLARGRVEVQAALERPARPAAIRRPVVGGEAVGAERPTHARAPGDAAPATTGEIPPAPVAVGLEAVQRELAELRRRMAREDELRDEIQDLRRTLEHWMKRRPETPREDASPACEALVRAGLWAEHARSLHDEWSEARRGEPGLTPETLLLRRLESRLAPPRAEDGARPRIFVGAPGVGKTTTLAKLAARNEEGERDVVLVSLDPFRIGAQAQLRGYAELLEAPFLEAGSAEELPGILARHGRSALLIDTAGRSRRRDDGLEPLASLRRAVGRRAAIELVLDATAAPEVQREQLARFAVLEPDRVIVAKVDECESLASVANVVLDPCCPPVCWLANGQRVPEDLLVAEPSLFSGAWLGEAA